jgi:ABC-2 type transport system permease protein
MSAITTSNVGEAFREELRKVPAFLRRDFLIAWSYKVAFFSDWLNMIFQLALFSFVGLLVDPLKLPTFNGTRASYVEFVSVGIALSSLLQLGLGRAVTALRDEQLMGTLEPLLMTPTAPLTLQLGSLMYDLLYVPVRTALFLVLAAVVLHARFSVAGLGPMLLILLAVIPFVWGLGLISAAAVVAFRKGSSLVGVGGILLGAASSAYFPVAVLPGSLRVLARLNPVTVALDATRDALLGGGGLSTAGPALVKLAPWVAFSFAGGVLALRLALARERRRGSLGLY